ncbi:hypothetical protein NMF51_09685 [Pseudomonas aeruginosa]|nr:hypothetical protein [Pseudomonas aeruginosa]
MTESKICACPSGDGSLRWPCPKHPAVDQADVAAKLTFINGRPAMCGCQVEYSDGGGEYSDVIYVTLCAKHSGSAILDLVATNRIALTPEYEGQWHADLYLDREIPLAKVEGATPAEAVLALMSAERIDPKQESVEQAGANVGHGHVFPRADGVKMRCGGPGLCSECTADASRARAALAQPSPAQADEKPGDSILCYGCFAKGVGPDHFDEAGKCLAAQAEQAEAERPEVVAYRTIGRHEKHQHPHYALNYYKQNAEDQAAHWRERGCEVSNDELMTVTQHARIVGALRADRDSWAEQAEQRLADWDEMRKERDAALARVAELERQEPVALANRGLHAFWVKWTEAAAGLYGPGIKLYAAPVAQAQHSVPAYVSYTTQPAESLAGIALRQLKDESRWVEIRDINAHAFPDMRSHSYYPAGTVIKLPAAAPGKEGV